jgi:hypothetical protein
MIIIHIGGLVVNDERHLSELTGQRSEIRRT